MGCPSDTFTRVSPSFGSNRVTMPRSSLGHLRTSRCPGGRSLSAAIRTRPLKSLDINRCANVRRGFSAYESTYLRDATRDRVTGENTRVACPDKGLIARPIFHAMDMVLESYVPVVIFAVVALLFPLGTFFATRLFRPDHPTPLKDLTYECGEVPEGVAQIQFHFQYYMLALIFVIFDYASFIHILLAIASGILQ